MGDDKEGRLNDPRQDGENERPPNHDHGKWLLRLSADSIRKCRRQQPEGGDERRHEDRAESLLRRLSRCQLDCVTLGGPQPLK